MGFISVTGVGKVYVTASGEPVRALAGIDLEIARGEFVSLIGPSGCGKSTLLHIVGGLQEPTDGRVEIDGEVIDRPRPDVAAFVFQDYTLFPWKTVIDNVELGLLFRGVDKATRRTIAERNLELVGLTSFAGSYPTELSGGMQQRVAIARALSLDPEVLLMDEPFGALDEQTRTVLGEELTRLLGAGKTTTVFVTHSLSEAIYLADRVVVMSARPGRIKANLEVGEPRPRDPEFMLSERFTELRNQLFSLLHEEFVETARLEMGEEIAE